MSLRVGHFLPVIVFALCLLSGAGHAYANRPPIATPDRYIPNTLPPVLISGRWLPRFELNMPPNGLLANDRDPDGDPIHVQGDFGGGPVFGGSNWNWGVGTNGGFSFGTSANLDYPNIPPVITVTYRVCDNHGACSFATATMLVFGEVDDAENAGVVGRSCHAIGHPVNVANGNMYLQHTDHTIPSVIGALNLTRTYNSASSRSGLFGQGWSTLLDESIEVYNPSILRLHLPDGRAVFFNQSGANFYPEAPGDFRGQIVKESDGSYTLYLKDGTSHEFDQSGRLTAVMDRNSNRTVLAYSSAGLLQSVTNPFGRQLSIGTDAATGRVLSIGDAMGAVAGYTYGASGELLSVRHGSRLKYQYTYAPVASRLVLTAALDPLGNILEAHEYDSQGRALTSERQGGVEKYTLSYTSPTETVITDALGRVTNYTHKSIEGRRVVERIDGSCSCGSTRTTTWSYDAQANVTAITDALGISTTYSYDDDGDLLSVTDVLGAFTFTYNAYGQVLTVTDPLSGVTSNSYDSKGNLLSVRNALGHTTAFTYDERGLLQNVTDARGKATRYTY